MPHASHDMALQGSGFTFNFRLPLRWEVLRLSLLELSLELLELLELELCLVLCWFRVGNLLEEAASFAALFRVSNNFEEAAGALLRVGNIFEEAASFGALFRVGNIFEEAASFGALRSLMELADHDATSAVAEKS